MTTLMTKTCPRCNGTGKHSFNVRDGDMCYGCQGEGIVLANPKAEGVKVNADALYAIEGDIVSMRGVGTCRVVEVQRGEFPERLSGPVGPYVMIMPEKLVLESLINGKRYRFLRYTPELERENNGQPEVRNRRTGGWKKAKRSK